MVWAAHVGVRTRWVHGAAPRGAPALGAPVRTTRCRGDRRTPSGARAAAARARPRQEREMLQTWSAKERSTAGGTLTTLSAGSPAVDVLARDGLGTMAVNPAQVRPAPRATPCNVRVHGRRRRDVRRDRRSRGAGRLERAFPLADGLGLLDGLHWNAFGRRSDDQRKQPRSRGWSKADDRLWLQAAGGPGASAPASGAVQTWLARQRSSPGGSLTALAASARVIVLAPDGSGTLPPRCRP